MLGLVACLAHDGECHYSTVRPSDRTRTNNSLLVVIIVAMLVPASMPAVVVPSTLFPVSAWIAVNDRCRRVDYGRARFVDNRRRWRLVDNWRRRHIDGCRSTEINANIHVGQSSTGRTRGRYSQHGQNECAFHDGLVTNPAVCQGGPVYPPNLHSRWATAGQVKPARLSRNRLYAKPGGARQSASRLLEPFYRIPGTSPAAPSVAQFASGALTVSDVVRVMRSRMRASMKRSAIRHMRAHARQPEQAAACRS